MRQIEKKINPKMIFFKKFYVYQVAVFALNLMVLQ